MNEWEKFRIVQRKVYSFYVKHFDYFLKCKLEKFHHLLKNFFFEQRGRGIDRRRNDKALGIFKWFLIKNQGNLQNQRIKKGVLECSLRISINFVEVVVFQRLKSLFFHRPFYVTISFICGRYLIHKYLNFKILTRFRQQEVGVGPVQVGWMSGSNTPGI